MILKRNQQYFQALEGRNENLKNLTNFLRKPFVEMKEELLESKNNVFDLENAEGYALDLRAYFEGIERELNETDASLRERIKIEMLIKATDTTYPFIINAIKILLNPNQIFIVNVEPMRTVLYINSKRHITQNEVEGMKRLFADGVKIDGVYYTVNNYIYYYNNIIIPWTLGTELILLGNAPIVFGSKTIVKVGKFKEPRILERQTQWKLGEADILLGDAPIIFYSQTITQAGNIHEGIFKTFTYKNGKMLYKNGKPYLTHAFFKKT